MRGLITASVVVLGLSAGSARAGNVDADYHETFPVGEDASLRLDHGDGDVTVEVWDRSEIEIRVRYRAEYRGSEPDPEFEVTFSHEGSSVNAVGREKHHPMDGRRFRFYRSLEYEWEVKVPRDVELVTRGEDGDVRIRGTRGSLEIRGGDGDVWLRDVESPEGRIRVSDGDVTVTGWICPDAEFRVSDGDLNVEGLRARQVDVRTSDGDVELELVGEDRLDLEIQGSDGDVRVTLPGSTNAEILLTSGDGRVRVEADARDEDRSRDAYYGVMGKGEGRVRIGTTDGGITLRARS